MRSSIPAVAWLAVSSVVSGCGFLGGSQLTATNERSVAPEAGIVSAHVTSAKGNTNTDVAVDGLTSARYALFLSSSGYTSAQALVALDVNAKCGGTDKAAFVSVQGKPACVVSDLTTDGSATTVVVFQGTSEVASAPVGAGHDVYVVLRELNGKSLSAQVSLSASDSTDSPNDDSHGPQIEPATLP